MSTPTTYLVAGLPKAGKTTFLAALWQVLESGDTVGSLRLGSLAHHEQTYLNRIRDSWFRCEELQRTTMADEQAATVPFLSKNGKTDILVFPDLSGETFQNQWATRQWTRQFAELSDHCQGCLLFVNPEYIRGAHSLADAHQANPAAAAGDDPATPWDPAIAPTQVILVDLLQSLLRRMRTDAAFRLAIVVSAWDVVSGDRLPPDEWVRNRLPLLSQYLASNADFLQFKIFGISAQGGSLTKDRDRLLQIASPSNRVLVVCGTDSSADISWPVRWLLEGPAGP
jgi:hypothetical protein